MEWDGINPIRFHSISPLLKTNQWQIMPFRFPPFHKFLRSLRHPHFYRRFLSTQPDVFLFWWKHSHFGFMIFMILFYFQFWHAVKVQTLALVEALEGVQGDGWVVDVVLGWSEKHLHKAMYATDARCLDILFSTVLQMVTRILTWEKSSNPPVFQDPCWW